ncbi:hypothetical protein ACFT30_11800 [Microbacterium ureisolvens]|uniref:hypothetical protein n=1 Tax=Microbacterium ureisolvens TaxID=2781186 RepID=UPI00362CA36C
MNLAETLLGLRRRWYIVVPGILLAVVLAAVTWFLVKPTYQTSATQLLIPSSGSFAPNTGNPFLNLGGLSQAADVLVGAMGADDVAGEIMDEHDGSTIVVARDWGNSGPSILFTVTARSESEATAVLREIVDQTEVVLDELQDDEGIEEDFRINTIPITFDANATIDQKSRMTTAAGVGAAVAIFAVLLAAVLDGLLRRRRAAVSDVAARRSSNVET